MSLFAFFSEKTGAAKLNVFYNKGAGMDCQANFMDIMIHFLLKTVKFRPFKKEFLSKFITKKAPAQEKEPVQAPVKQHFTDRK